MTAPGAPTIRMLDLDDVERYVRHVHEVDAGSGVDGAPHFHPYPRDERFDLDAAHAREVVRWTTPIESVGWRRAWGLLDGDELVGHLYLEGGSLRSELHRVGVGMAIARSHRGCGGGTGLLSAAIAWARAQPTIEWVDLGVFSDNPRAQALYERHGFQVVGRTTDRFRVDGCSLDDISMTLAVGP